MPLESDKNNKIAINQIRKMVINTSQGVRNSMQGVARQFENNARKAILDPPKSGRFYRLKINGVVQFRQASKAGEPPANQTGNLRKNVTRVSRKNEVEFGVQGVEYARGLELGRTKGVNGATSTMSPRPYLIRAINEESKNAFVILKARIKEAVLKK